jgi:hypothetical protein
MKNFHEMAQQTKRILEQTDRPQASGTQKRLVELINEFEATLPNDEQAGGRLVSFGETVTFLIEKIGYYNPYLVIFHGRLPDGSSVQLIQHQSQISVLLTAMKRLNPEEPRRKIGFDTSEK